MDSINRISEAELEIMKVLWNADTPVATGTIYKELSEKLGWDRSTVRTLLKRLWEKGAVEERRLKVLCYLPAVSEDEYLHSQTKSFLSRLYGGSAKRLVASLVQNDELTPSDIEELRAYLASGGVGHE
jgi:BlaI family penicillinase repressor